MMRRVDMICSPRTILVGIVASFLTTAAPVWAEYEQEYVLVGAAAEVQGASFSLVTRSGEELPGRLDADWSDENRTVVTVVFPGSRGEPGTLVIRKQPEAVRFQVPRAGGTQVVVVDLETYAVRTMARSSQLPDRPRHRPPPPPPEEEKPYAGYEQEYVLVLPRSALEIDSISFRSSSGEALPVEVSDEWSDDDRTVVLVTFPGIESHSGSLTFKRWDEVERFTIPSIPRGQVAVVDPDKREIRLEQRRDTLPGKEKPGIRRERRQAEVGVSDRGFYGEAEVGLASHDVAIGGEGSGVSSVTGYIASPELRTTGLSTGLMVGFNTDRTLFGWSKTSDVRFELRWTAAFGDGSTGGVSPARPTDPNAQAGWVLATGEPVDQGGVEVSAATSTDFKNNTASLVLMWNQGSAERDVRFLPRVILSYTRRAFNTDSNVTSRGTSVLSNTVVLTGELNRAQDVVENAYSLGLGFRTMFLKRSKRIELDVEGHFLDREAALTTDEDSRWFNPFFSGTWRLFPTSSDSGQAFLDDEDSGSALLLRVAGTVGWDISPGLQIGARAAIAHLDKTAAIFNPKDFNQDPANPEMTELRVASDTSLRIVALFRF